MKGHSCFWRLLGNWGNKKKVGHLVKGWRECAVNRWGVQEIVGQPTPAFTVNQQRGWERKSERDLIQVCLMRWSEYNIIARFRLTVTLQQKLYLLSIGFYIGDVSHDDLDWNLNHLSIFITCPACWLIGRQKEYFNMNYLIISIFKCLFKCKYLMWWWRS